jgi:acylphosphatase
VTGDPAVRLIVSGRVQGVGYRAWTVAAARHLGLRGWVRNRLDGTVEILAIGHADRIDQLAQDCAEGPRAACVAAVQRMHASDDRSVSFSQRATG